MKRGLKTSALRVCRLLCPSDVFSLPLQLGIPSYSFVYLILGLLGLCCFVWAFLVAASRGLLCVAACGLLTAVASLVAERRLWSGLWSGRASVAALSSSRALAQWLRCAGLVATGHGGSSYPRDPTHVSCIGK